MMKTLTMPTIFLLIITLDAGLVSANALDKFVICNVENPVFQGNELFRAYEDFYSPRVSQLREQYALDEIVAGESDEFRRIMLLRHWIHSTMPIDDDNSTPTRLETFAILEAAVAGGKFNCTHFSIVQHAVLNSFGYVTRCLGTGPGLENGPKGYDGHHGVNEVWVNTLNKWVLVDAKYDLHFEKEGIPLSALDIRDEVWRNDAKDVVCAFGLEGKPMVPQINDPDWGIWATPEAYRWCSWDTNTNLFTAFPAALSSTLIMYDDDIFQNNIWYRDGKPHWAYDTPFLIKTTQRNWIYWTPNVISSAVRIGDDHAHIFLRSFTPNFKTFQMKIAGEGWGEEGLANEGWTEGGWRDCSESLQLPLRQQVNRFVFRTVNLFGVTGPPHRIEIERKELGFGSRR